MLGLAEPAAGRVLVVDDEESSRELCRLALAPTGCDVVLCENADQALQQLRSSAFDAVLTDMVMPGATGIELLEQIRAQNRDLPVLLMSGKGSIQAVVQAMKLGAEDFIEKPFADPEVVSLAVNRALKASRLREENRRLRQELQQLRKQPTLIGAETLRELLRTVERVAPLDLTVLITGETGTGKEIIARRIHAQSPRANRAFVAINCGGIPEGLLESLLFGHERGAFTGAIKRTAGFFEKAHHGTILLDEIGDMPTSLQVKLLRVLQEKSFQRVGGDKVIDVDCRVLASTHRNLRQMVAEGKFREDLFYRLNVVNIQAPPLRERKDDIPVLAEYFLKNAAARLSKRANQFSPEALDCLARHAWPGNIRELENVVERTVALSQGEVLEADALPQEFRLCILPPVEKPTIPYLGAREEFERDYWLRALRENSGNVSAASQASGIPRQNLYLKLKKYGIDPSGSRP